MLPLVKNDHWLTPVSKAVDDRHNRFEWRLNDIKNRYGSLMTFATAHQFLGFNYDKRRHGWWYREWAPAAHYLSLMGDFNNWNRYEYPLELAGSGFWEIFLPDSEFADRLVHGSKLKVLVQSQIGEHERIPVYIRRVIQDDNTKDFAGQFWNPPTPYVYKHAAPQLKNEPLLSLTKFKILLQWNQVSSRQLFPISQLLGFVELYLSQWALQSVNKFQVSIRLCITAHKF